MTAQFFFVDKIKYDLKANFYVMVIFFVSFLDLLTQLQPWLTFVWSLLSLFLDTQYLYKLFT